ncbi:MAG: type II toxin-antitoxin system PemK/MazF family toxin [Azonexus sp.]|jgi:mRNA interferase MazF|nr:type II toxin-antitoxin system PemK/MazF family toxin [Azonexus sp.]
MTATLSLWAPERGDIVWIDHNPSVGREIPDRHPMLVMSTQTFNRKTGIVIGFPMTHSEMNADNPFAIPIIGPNQEKAYILAFQPKSFDWRQRDARLHPWGGGHDKALKRARQTLDTICSISAP